MKKILFGFVALILATPVAAQVNNGKVTTAAPTYATGAVAPFSLDTAGNLRVSGSPSGTQKVGCTYNSTFPTYTNGQSTECQSGSRGSLNVTLYGADNATAIGGVANNADGVTAVATGSNQRSAAYNYVWNGATWDRLSGTTAGANVSQAGTWTVQPGNTANTTPWLQTISQGGNSATVSAGGALKTDASATTQPVSGTIAATQSGTWTVQPGNTANTTAWKVDGSAVTQPVSGTFGVGTTGAAVPAAGGYQANNVGGLLTGQIGCGSSVVYDASTSGSTHLVALASSQSVYVCGYSIIAGGTVNVKLITGTGSACATGSANITPAYQLTAQAGISDGSPIFRGLKGAASSALCINASAGIAVQAIVYYTQF